MHLKFAAVQWSDSMFCSILLHGCAQIAKPPQPELAPMGSTMRTGFVGGRGAGPAGNGGGGGGYPNAGGYGQGRGVGAMGGGGGMGAGNGMGGVGGGMPAMAAGMGQMGGMNPMVSISVPHPQYSSRILRCLV